MKTSKLLETAVYLACLVATGSAGADEAASFKYDAFGRLKKVTSVRASNTAWVDYTYDVGGNRTQLVVSGSASNGNVTISPVGLVANETSYGISLSVTVTGTGAPSGTVTFSENGVFLGSMFVNGGQAGIILEGFPLGVHHIVASYSGDGTHAASTIEFDVRVQSLAWLPSVLELLLSN